jgi:hypothetical protein
MMVDEQLTLPLTHAVRANLLGSTLPQPATKVLDLKDHVRCRACGATGSAIGRSPAFGIV